MMAPKSSCNDPLSAALSLLSYRARSEHELASRLEDKGFTPTEIHPTLSYLKEAGYLNDERFARELVETRVRNKYWGRSRIAADLRKRKVPGVVADRALAIIDDEEEAATAEKALRKWSRKTHASPPLGENEQKRAYRHLRSRGFSTSIIMPLIKGLKELK